MKKFKAPLPLWREMTKDNRVELIDNYIEWVRTDCSSPYCEIRWLVDQLLHSKHELDMICILSDTTECYYMDDNTIKDYVIYDRANNSLVRFNESGEIILYGDKEEAVENCYGNEKVFQFDKLPKDKQKEIINQLNK